MSSVPYIPNPQTLPPYDGQDTCNSFYEYVKTRILSINSGRVFGGIVQARDWPPTAPTIGAFYLVLLPRRPSKILGNSPSGPMYSFGMQWAWMLQGDDVPQNAQAANRGNKYALQQQMESELIFGLFPGFCLKQHFTVAADSSGNAVLNTVPFSPPDNLWWNLARFADKIEKTSGIMFGSGTVEVTSFMPQING